MWIKMQKLPLVTWKMLEFNPYASYFLSVVSSCINRGSNVYFKLVVSWLRIHASSAVATCSCYFRLTKTDNEQFNMDKYHNSQYNIRPKRLRSWEYIFMVWLTDCLSDIEIDVGRALSFKSFARGRFTRFIKVPRLSRDLADRIRLY